MEEEVARSWISKNHLLWKRIRYQVWFEQYKSEKFRCVICKNDNPVVLEFHHLDPKKKKYNISTMIYQCMKLIDIQAELKKCIVLCSNCHALVEDNSVSKDELLQKAREEHDKHFRPGEDILEDFAALMLENINPFIVYRYDDAYISNFRVRQNFYDYEFEKHPDYIDFYRKYILSKQSETANNLKLTWGYTITTS
jgi:hypothetical protein